MSETNNLKSNNFKQYNFKQYINQGLESINFVSPTDVQETVITKALNGENIIAKSPTGTGKTHAFILPMLEKITNSGETEALIIVPTRELGYQIYEEIMKITKFSSEPIDVRLYVGGTNREGELSRLTKAQPTICIGTIGKLKDLAVESNSLKIHTAKYVVIDEADMTFEMEELGEIDAVFSRLQQFQFLLFSATISQEILTFVKKYLAKPTIIDLVGKSISKDSIEHIFIPSKNKNKDVLLVELLQTFHPYLALIFANTKKKVYEISEMLGQNNFKVAIISGDLEARERKQVLRRIKNGDYQYVVASDIASRGLDITGVSQVINYELPDDIEFYIHRIGRTARFDSTGMAISFYDYEDDRYINKLKAKGLHCIFKMLRDNELVDTKMRTRPLTRSEEIINSVHTKIPLSKKVKPGYKKKRKEEIEKETKKIKRSRINEIYRRKNKQ